MHYFHEEIATLTTSMRDLLTRMADQDRDADDVAITNLQRIKNLEAIQANQRLSSAAGERDKDRQRIEKLQEYRAADRERIKLLRDRITELEFYQEADAEGMKRMHGEIRNGAERLRQLERMVDPHGDIDQT